MKRKAADRLTGGTDDVNPQWFKINTDVNVAQAIAPGGTLARSRIQRFTLPVQRINQTDKNTATIVEVLKVRWAFALATSSTSANEPPYSSVSAGFLSTAPLADDTVQPQLRGTTVDWFSVDDFVQPFNVSGGADPVYTGYAESSNGPLPIIHDLTDGDGHGILVATDAVNLLLRTTLTNESTAGGGSITWDTSALSCEILYRYKKVALTEYIGIIQSQERSN